MHTCEHTKEISLLESGLASHYLLSPQFVFMSEGHQVIITESVGTSQLSVSALVPLLAQGTVLGM